MYLSLVKKKTSNLSSQITVNTTVKTSKIANKVFRNHLFLAV